MTHINPNHNPFSNPAQPHEQDPPLPADLHAVAQRLEALAMHERAAAPRGLEDRVLRAVMASAKATAVTDQTDASAAVRAPDVLARVGPSKRLAAFRLAAALALVASLGLITMWLTRGPTSVTSNGPLAVNPAPSEPAQLDAALLESELQEFLASAEGADALAQSQDEDTQPVIADSFWDSTPTIAEESL